MIEPGRTEFDPPATAGGALPSGLVSVVVPAYNEKDNIAPLLEAIDGALAGKVPYEIVVVDDGSHDGTREELLTQKRGRPHLRVVGLDRNHGQTAAFGAGITAAHGDVIVTMDADLQNDPQDVLALLERLEGADAVVGYRTVRRDSWLRRLSSRLANRIRNKLTNESIRDVGCSLKVFRAAPLRSIPLFEGLHRFFPTLLKMRGYRVVEVPVGHHPRRHGQSKYGVRNRLLRSLLDCLAVRWMQWRLLRYKASELGEPSSPQARADGNRVALGEERQHR
ncbi:MAG: glycosyltransferase family 2 protein [Planctomycetota bacterium]